MNKAFKPDTEPPPAARPTEPAPPTARASRRASRLSDAPPIPSARGSRRAYPRPPRPRAPQIVDHPKPSRPERHRELDLEALPENAITRVHIELTADGLAEDVLIPVMVARGSRPGPVFGITAAVHGNELNGIRVIHDLFANIDTEGLRGTVVGVLAVNVPGLHYHQRNYLDGQDLNHIFPGDAKGNAGQVFAHRIVNRVVRRFDYLVDLHTASAGRVNSLYVRADMTNAKCARMAYLQRPQIIVHNPASDRTLRGTAMDLGIPAITVEIGDPQRFQPSYIRSSRTGLLAVLADARMLQRRAVVPGPEPVVCSGSYWLYADRGGLLEVMPSATQLVQKNEKVATLRDAFGDLLRDYCAPEDGIVVGKSVNPVGTTGARILHLGIIAPENDSYLKRDPLEATASRPASELDLDLGE